MACLRLGRAPAVQIDESSALPRTTAYDVLAKLAKVGLVSASHINHRLHFSPSDPESLLNSPDQRRDTITRLLPELRTIRGNTRTETTVDVHQGDVAIRKLLDAFMESHGEWCVLGSLRTVLDAIDYPAGRFSARRSKHRVTLRHVTADGSELAANVHAYEVRCHMACHNTKTTQVILQDRACLIEIQEPSAIDIQFRRMPRPHVRSSTISGELARTKNTPR